MRDGEIILINNDDTIRITPSAAPELLEEFIDNGNAISMQEIFYLTRVALCARESADNATAVSIEE